MKVAYLINQYPKVSHSFIRREIKGLEDLGLNILRFSIRRSKDILIDSEDQIEEQKTTVILEQKLHILGLRLICQVFINPVNLLHTLLRTLGIGLKSERGVWIHLIYLVEACFLAEELKKKGCNHIHAHFGTNSTTVALLCHFLGGSTYSFTAHGPEEFDKGQQINLTEKITNAEFVVAVSSFGRSQLYRYCSGKHWNKIKVVHCGIDQEYISVLKPFFPTDQNIVCVGRLCEQKGQLLLLDAISSLISSNFSIHLTLVGDGEMRAEIEEKVKKNQLEDFVTITGWANGERVRSEILNSKIFVLPSFAEGLPVVLMEAMALSRPVISTYIAGIPELIEDNFNGWLVPAGSVTDLVRSIKNALETDISTLETMGENGQQKVLEHFNVKDTSKLLYNLLLGKV